MTGQGTETKRLPKAIRASCPSRSRARRGSTPRTCRPSCSTRSGRRSATGSSRSPTAGQLGSILLQYPRWFFPSSENRDAIEDGRRAARRLDGCAVEFRNGSWFNEKNAERTLRFLGDRKIAFVMVDEPQGFKSSVPPIVGGDLATSRSSASTAATPRPGRRRASRRPSASATSTRATSSRSGRRASARSPRKREDTHVLMNNCYANYGTTNAREMAAILAGELSP